MCGIQLTKNGICDVASQLVKNIEQKDSNNHFIEVFTEN